MIDKYDLLKEIYFSGGKHRDVIAGELGVSGKILRFMEREAVRWVVEEYERLKEVRTDDS